MKISGFSSTIDLVYVKPVEYVNLKKVLILPQRAYENNISFLFQTGHWIMDILKVSMAAFVTNVKVYRHFVL